MIRRSIPNALHRCKPSSSSSTPASFAVTLLLNHHHIRFCSSKQSENQNQEAAETCVRQQQQQQQQQDQQQSQPPLRQAPAAQWSWKLPPGIEVYSACVFLIAGWWYWLEAHFRKIDRRCEVLEQKNAEQTKQLGEVVGSAKNRWQNDVKGKEDMMLKVQKENARLAQMLDQTTSLLRRCSVQV